MGQVVVEAMLARVPVIVSDAGGLPEVVGKTCCVVPRGEPEALAQAIEQGLSEWRYDCSAAEQRARELFSVGRMVEKTLAVYSEILERSSSSTE